MKINKLFIFFILISQGYLSQTVKDTVVSDSIDPVYRRLRLALNYSSANTFLGKKDSVSIPILTPTIKYTTSKDFFYQLNLVHSNTTDKLFDQLDLRAGYNYYFNDQWNATISYTRSFYSKAVDRLNAIVNNDINLYVGYDWNHVYTALSLDYTSGSKDYSYTYQDTVWGKNGKKYALIDTKETGNVSAKDYTITLMNSRQFYFYELFNENDKLIVCPEIDVYYGSQNSVQQSNVARKLAKGKKQTTTTSTSTDNTSYPFMAYTFNLDLRYVYKKLTFNLSPYYTIPQKLASDMDTQQPFFVMYGGLFYTWKWEKK